MIIGFLVVLPIESPKDIQIVSGPPNEKSSHQPMDINDEIVHIRPVLRSNDGQV
jgi:hypothetical protein